MVEQVTDLDKIPWKYKPIRISITNKFNGEKLKPQSVMALCYKGLAYHPAFNNNSTEIPEGWCVTHIKTGLRLGGISDTCSTEDFKTEEAAAAFLLDISSICNWNDLEKIRENKDQLMTKVKELYPHT